MRAWMRVAVAVAGRPSLWPTAARQARRLARPHWWRHAPFLPVPHPAYARFRSITQSGGTGAPPSPRDVVSYLSWCRQWEHVVA